ncbi:MULTISPECIES: hypothetical protein [Desulfobacula]|uniref:Uncharacterized protein n=2 Tax=Desulfobacula TaxID=28222 RepID=K0NMD1_DESTT|nr:MULTISPECIES: hypothetical protein [Desulfobacula]CCK81183.1 uncharacterized protein TOL2_C30240 [Desulfobacula toluolica Tol2]SDU38047.1 hypothetical protein SAMN04487931_107182 [Desulfobacula phenolica]
MNLKSFADSLPHAIDSDPIVMGELAGYTLAAPRSFWETSKEIRSEVVNGCGPGGLGDFMVPDTVYFVSIKAACMIHDWCFTVFNSEAGFKLSNQIFLDNMQRIVRAETYNKLLMSLRLARVKKYYRAVQDFGRVFYYDAHVDLYSDEHLYSDCFSRVSPR